MTSRSRFTAEERAARSRLAQVLHDREVICGSIVEMARQCGKKGCHCEQGEKHVSVYLSVRVKGKRRMLFIPHDLEEEVRQRVAAWREVSQLTEVVSRACTQRILERKAHG